MAHERPDRRVAHGVAIFLTAVTEPATLRLTPAQPPNIPERKRTAYSLPRCRCLITRDLISPCRAELCMWRIITMHRVAAFRRGRSCPTVPLEACSGWFALLPGAQPV